jgi:phage terminase large subunit GpA-like protein
MIKSTVLRQVWPKAWTLGLTRNVATWADQHRRLTKHSSQYAGRWKTDRFPYQRGPMDAFSNLKASLLVLSWATQTGKTELQLNCQGYAIDEQPGPILCVYPSEKIVRKVSTTRIQPMINSARPLRDKKHPSADKFKIEEMHFLDCILYLASAQVPGDLASMPIQYLFCDEVGKFPTFSGKEGDPVKLAMERQKAFPFTSKTVLVSSPTTPDGPISRYFNSCQERLQFFIPCPHCHTMQILDFNQIKWDVSDLDSADPQAWREAKRTALYFCPSCGAAISDQEKVVALQSGEWLREDGTPPDPDAESIGFKLSSLYSPLITWGTIAAEFLQAKQDPATLMVFLNGWLCQEWEDAAIEKKDPHVLLQSNATEYPARTVPKDAWVLTAGIDSQAAGFYFVVRAWLRDRTSFLIDYGFLPSFKDVQELVFNRAYPMHNDPQDRRMGIWRACLDTGGTRIDDGPSMTEAAYNFLRSLPKGRIFGIKGASWKTGVRVTYKNFDRFPNGKPIPGGLTVFLLDTAAFKEALHYRLSIDKEKPGAFLFHAETGQDYIEGLLSEFKRRDTRTGKEAWVPIRGRENHYLDCEIYSMAATDTQMVGGIDLLKGPMAVLNANQVPEDAQVRTTRPPQKRKIWLPNQEKKSGWLQR